MTGVQTCALPIYLGIIDTLRGLNKELSEAKNDLDKYDVVRKWRQHVPFPEGTFHEDHHGLEGRNFGELYYGLDSDAPYVNHRNAQIALENAEKKLFGLGYSEKELRERAGMDLRDQYVIGGSYDRKTNTVKLNEHGARYDTETVLTHELTHAIASHAIDNPTPAQRPHVRNLEKLYEAVKADPSMEGQYGISSIHEFLS